MGKPSISSLILSEMAGELTRARGTVPPGEGMGERNKGGVEIDCKWLVQDGSVTRERAPPLWSLTNQLYTLGFELDIHLGIPVLPGVHHQKDAETHLLLCYSGSTALQETFMACSLTYLHSCISAIHLFSLETVLMVSAMFAHCLHFCRSMVHSNS